MKTAKENIRNRCKRIEMVWSKAKYVKRSYLNRINGSRRLIKNIVCAKLSFANDNGKMLNNKKWKKMIIFMFSVCASFI